MAISSLLKLLAVGLVLAGGLQARAASAATLFVSNCNDSGPGSLRDTISLAADGDTVDISTQTASCNRLIRLSSGEIRVPQDNLTITGYVDRLNGSHLYGEKLSRIMHHTGSGTLALKSLHFHQGLVVGNLAIGGCLLSEGDLDITFNQFTECEVRGEGGVDPMALGAAVHARSLNIRDGAFTNNRAIGARAAGGAISTEGRVTLLRTYMSSNSARDAGAIISLGGATLTYSSIEYNFALHDAGGVSVSGGSVTINKTTIAHNTAAHRCGGLCITGTGRTSMFDSTLHSNQALYLGAGELSDEAEIFNSTITRNWDRAQHECVGVIRAKFLHMQSSIVAGNFCENGMPAYDIGGRPWEGYRGIGGQHNLIGRSRVLVPFDTISGDPRLGDAIQHGSWFATIIPLLPDSPAINRGNNFNNRLYDQRGPGFPREQDGRADIGAYEVQVP